MQIVLLSNADDNFICAMMHVHVRPLQDMYIVFFFYTIVFSQPVNPQQEIKGARGLWCKKGEGMRSRKMRGMEYNGKI